MNFKRRPSPSNLRPKGSTLRPVRSAPYSGPPTSQGAREPLRGPATDWRATPSFGLDLLCDSFQVTLPLLGRRSHRATAPVPEKEPGVCAPSLPPAWPSGLRRVTAGDRPPAAPSCPAGTCVPPPRSCSSIGVTDAGARGAPPPARPSPRRR